MASSLIATSTKVKRKRGRENDEDTADKTVPVTTSAERARRKRKKQKKAKQPADDVKDADKKDSIDESIGKMDGKLLADYLAQKAKRHNKDLTAVELDDIYVPDYAFTDTTLWESPRTLENLPAFLKKYSPKKGSLLSQAAEANGSPHTLLVTLAGLRAADLTRALRQFQNQDCAVAKLFAKHIKLAESQEFVKKTRELKRCGRVGIGIGTPVRLNDLIDTADGYYWARRFIMCTSRPSGIFELPRGASALEPFGGSQSHLMCESLHLSPRISKAHLDTLRAKNLATGSAAPTIVVGTVSGLVKRRLSHRLVHRPLRAQYL
ncbi:conserved hypothetical protein [Uncinocarpus reesii 1704]|uniref:Protein CMS1 n=1 Tax=Uncinocarpus reesii (strain UAMH 1704) TaxID=336963 RepID=C4JE46_UNCRE|nr:uncharacterized protein UREG_00470 [Uncinocarpus reesii 1704]EEP75624.1 conserved hypothetical protein [Uncinocarpus reesii 1704]